MDLLPQLPALCLKKQQRQENPLRGAHLKSANEMGRESNNSGLTSTLGSFRGREFQKDGFYGDVNPAKMIGPVINFWC